MNKQYGKYGNADGRWAGFGPYYAMFPVGFARAVIETMSPRRGGRVMDPFCGRGTAPFVAQATGRASLGIDLNPVAWVFAKVKTDPEPNVGQLLYRLKEVQKEVCAENRMPQNEFQEWAWCREVLGFLNAARRVLDWRESKTDRTLMGFILAHLHANHESGLSNQLQNSRSMGPEYAVRWWKSREMRPPVIDPVSVLSRKVKWRYRHGVVDCRKKALIELGDSSEILATKTSGQFNLLFTSPPYCNVTDYRQDSWIRLWMLKEGPALPDWKKDSRTVRQDLYKKMINDVLINASRLLTPRGVVWIRTDAREFTKEVTLNAVRKIWLNRKLFMREDIPKCATQTEHFRNLSSGTGEVDLLIPGSRPLPFNAPDWKLL